MLSCFSRVRLFVAPRTVAPQASPSMGVLQARILEWVAMPSSQGSSWPRDRTQVSRIAGGFFTISADWEAHKGRSPITTVYKVLHVGITVHYCMRIVYFFKSCPLYLSTQGRLRWYKEPQKQTSLWAELTDAEKALYNTWNFFSVNISCTWLCFFFFFLFLKESPVKNTHFMQIKTTMRYHLTLISMVMSKIHK